MEQARWDLQAIGSTCEWMSDLSISGIWRILDRLKIGWIRGRDHVHSPDPYYQEKLSYIKEISQKAKDSGGRIVLVYEDELTYYRQPSLSYSYELRGLQPLAERSHKSNTTTRVAATLDALDGRVVHHQASIIGVSGLVKLYCKLRESYPQAERIYLVQDNWPVHFHADLLVALEPQHFHWPVPEPRGWTWEPSNKAVQKYGHLNLPIQIVQLPTYASWLNPVEKLWRMLKQDLLHMHRFADKLSELHESVSKYLDVFSVGSEYLLRYVGLLVPD